MLSCFSYFHFHAIIQVKIYGLILNYHLNLLTFTKQMHEIIASLPEIY